MGGHLYFTDECEVDYSSCRGFGCLLTPPVRTVRQLLCHHFTSKWKAVGDKLYSGNHHRRRRKAAHRQKKGLKKSVLTIAQYAYYFIATMVTSCTFETACCPFVATCSIATYSSRLYQPLCSFHSVSQEMPHIVSAMRSPVKCN